MAQDQSITAPSLGKVEVALTPQQRFEEYLQSRGKRNTTSRKILIDHVFSQHEHFDAETLIERLPRKGSKDYVSRATVYRALSEFVDAGLLREFELDGRSVYEHDYGYPQHDHLYCTKCEKLTEFQSDALISLRDEIADTYGFRVTKHRLIIHGVCEKCKLRRNRIKRRVDLI
jgi:Fur family ferric uptake transcriptional regulator